MWWRHASFEPRSSAEHSAEPSKRSHLTSTQSGKSLLATRKHLPGAMNTPGLRVTICSTRRGLGWPEFPTCGRSFAEGRETLIGSVASPFLISFPLQESWPNPPKLWTLLQAATKARVSRLLANMRIGLSTKVCCSKTDSPATSLTKLVHPPRQLSS